MIPRLLCRGPHWLWWCLYHFSPYHRGYDRGYEQAIGNVKACGWRRA
jgi:hypothetical protein